MLPNTRVLVTGGAGFIGSHTVDGLLKQGAKVTVVDNLSTGRKVNLNPGAKFYDMNLADESIIKIMQAEKPEVIYHFAFFVLVPKSVENPMLDMDVLTGSVRMLKAAKDLGVKKIVFASSGFLYGNTPNLPATEECPIDPVTPYVVSKQAFEGYLYFFNKAFGLPYVTLRYAAIYGPRQVTGAMADYIRKLSKGQQAEIWGDGNKTRDYVYIDDVVRANLMALDVKDDHPNPIFNIGTGKETTLNEIYWEIAKIVGTPPKPIYYPDRPGEQIRYCLDSSKAKRELGWEPKFSLNHGLSATIKAFEPTQ